MNDFHNPAAESYTSTADRLAGRIEALIPNHPEILTMTNVWDLFKISEFKVQDLEPSLYQASWALADVQQRAKR